ncbi:MAG: hypothetical protein ACTSQB_04240, partial [Candidatus Heimdallarchaeota archaeon]
QQPFKQQPNQENYSGNRGFCLFGGSRQQTHSAVDPMSGMSEEEWAKHIDTERKIMRATIFGWITFCSSVLSPIFLIITLVYVFQARKAIGRMDPRLTRALIYAVVGCGINIAINIGLYVTIFQYLFPA